MSAANKMIPKMPGVAAPESLLIPVTTADKPMKTTMKKRKFHVKLRISSLKNVTMRMMNLLVLKTKTPLRIDKTSSSRSGTNRKTAGRTNRRTRQMIVLRLGLLHRNILCRHAVLHACPRKGQR